MKYVKNWRLKMSKKLIQIDFDNMENRDAQIIKEFGIFIDEEGKTSHLKISE